MFLRYEILDKLVTLISMCGFPTFTLIYQTFFFLCLGIIKKSITTVSFFCYNEKFFLLCFDGDHFQWIRFVGTIFFTMVYKNKAILEFGKNTYI